jgi:hypothetical protein
MSRQRFDNPNENKKFCRLSKLARSQMIRILRNDTQQTSDRDTSSIYS